MNHLTLIKRRNSIPSERMMNMESTLNQILEKLTHIQSELDTIKTNMATKEDLSISFNKPSLKQITSSKALNSSGEVTFLEDFPLSNVNGRRKI